MAALGILERMKILMKINTILVILSLSFSLTCWSFPGGTLYNSVPTPEVPTRVMRGLRPPHLGHVSDDFYQLMLQCWQLDLDERPSFQEITATLCELINSSEVITFIISILLTMDHLLIELILIILIQEKLILDFYLTVSP